MVSKSLDPFTRIVSVGWSGGGEIIVQYTVSGKPPNPPGPSGGHAYDFNADLFAYVEGFREVTRIGGITTASGFGPPMTIESGEPNAYIQGGGTQFFIQTEAILELVRGSNVEPVDATIHFLGSVYRNGFLAGGEGGGNPESVTVSVEFDPVYSVGAGGTQKHGGGGKITVALPPPNTPEIWYSGGGEIGTLILNGRTHKGTM